MISRNVLVRLFYVLVIAGFVWWKFFRDPQTRAVMDAWARHETIVTAPPPGVESWPFKTEQHWMVSEIGRDIAEMIAYAKDPTIQVGSALNFAATAPSAQGKFQIAARSVDAEAQAYCTLTHHFWARENYAPWAKLLLEKWKIAVPTQSTAPNAALVKALTSPAQGLLIVEARRVSNELTQHPLDAELHEEAALLQGFLALQEAAGVFYDARHSLCRMSAHLALARALRTQQGVCGQLAEVIQLAVAGRESETLEKVAHFPADMQPWAMALKLRATADWRLLEDPEKATLMEQMEYGRALVRCGLTTNLGEFVEKIHASHSPQWGRMVMERDFDPGEGGTFVKDSLRVELEEMAEDWKAWSGKELNKDGLVLVANDAPGRCVANVGDGQQGMEVMGWGDLGAFHQRHVCHSALRTDDLLRRIWSAWDDATQFEQFMSKELSGLRLMPFVLKRCALNTASYAPAMRDSLALCNMTPQLVTAANWASVAEPERFGTRYENIPAPQAWFSPDLPVGTVYDFATRYYELHHLWQADLATWEKTLQTAPYDHDVIRAHRHKKYGEILTAQQVEDSFARTSAYNVWAMGEIAENSKSDPSKYIPAFKKIAALDGDAYVDLSEYLRVQHREEEAVEAYRSALEKAHDQVKLACHCHWLVDYEFDHGRKDEALKIATKAAEAHSAAGYEIMGALMERMERWSEAEKYYWIDAQRYKDFEPLTTFYMERREKDPRAAVWLNQIVDQIYPDGVEKATVADFSTAPEDGVVLITSNEYVQSAHLKKGDVIVVLNGYRIRTRNQYMWVRAIAGVEEPMRLVVWNGSKYIEVETVLPRHRFHSEMATYGIR